MSSSQASFKPQYLQANFMSAMSDNFSIFDEALTSYNNHSPMSVVINIEDATPAQRAKYQLFARKTVQKFLVTKDQEEYES